MFFMLTWILIMILIILFFLMGMKTKWNYMSMSIFECGFSSYFFSRFSFSIHYFLTALTFLILDLELCFLFPFFNEETAELKIMMFFLIFSTTLTLALIYEWKKGMLNWKK